MPGWSSRILHINTSSNPTTPAASSQAILDSELDSSDGYFTPIPPPSLQDLANPFGNTTQPYSIRNSPSRSRGHTRSVSDKLPSLLGVNRQKSGTNNDLAPRSVPNDSIFDGNVESAAMVGAGQSYGDEDGYDTGRCATCDQKVKWPKSRAEYRCGVCSMINDLTPKDVGSLLPALPSDATEAGRANATSNGARSQSKIAGDLLQLPQTDVPMNFSRPRGVSRSGQDELNPPPSSKHLEVSSLSPETLQSLELADTDPSLLSVQAPWDRLSPIDLPRGQPEASSRPVSRKPLPTRDEGFPPAPHRQPPKPPVDPRSSPQKTVKSGDLHSSRPTKTEESQHPVSQLSRQPSHQSSNTSYTNKAIFKTLEDSITRTFGNHGFLNSVFMKQSRRPQTANVDRGDRQLSPMGNDLPTKTPLSDIDPKTLLIGDIAENGLWWTGKDDRTMTTVRRKSHREQKHLERESSLVSSRSPYIIWSEAEKWYSLITNAGRDWRATLRTRQQQDPLKWTFSLSREDENSIDSAMSEARSHVQRVLLRASDNVLKRPGRPLKEASDYRFLLIMLANPMLYPGSPHKNEDSNAVGSLERKSSRQEHCSNPSKEGPSADRPGEAWDQSNAFAIAKRIFGLLSNSSGECQRFLTSWFSRYDEVHFRRLVGLLQGFVSRRLRRQSSRRQAPGKNIASDLIPSLSGSSAYVSAELHAAIGLSGKTSGPQDKSDDLPFYSEDWQIKAASRVMALLFAANKTFNGKRIQSAMAKNTAAAQSDSLSRHNIKIHGQLLSTTEFYNTMVDYCDVVVDFDTWEGYPSKFAFCQYPFFLSVGSKIRIMEHDARRQMEIKAREAFFKSLLRNAAVQQHMILRVRRECLVEDSLKGISEVVAQGQEEIKKGLKIQFVREEGVDAGGLRKEWFLLLVREIFDPLHAMFLYDEDSNVCYFNPHSFETSDQYFLVGALLGLAIYNSTILDVALPPFIFKKLLLSGGAFHSKMSPFTKGRLRYSLEDLAEWRPQLAKGLRDLLEFDGNVQEVFCRDFVIEVDRYGEMEQVELCSGGARRPVTNENRYEFVELYIRYLLDTQVTRQFEPFKRGFFTVCGGNALSLFQPEEIELLVRGSEEPLDVPNLKAVAVYDNWRTAVPQCRDPSTDSPLVRWFWEAFESASTNDQRKLLGFITGSDRIPAVGATSLIIKLVYGGDDARRLPTARTCFNQIMLHGYRSRQELEEKLWLAVSGSQGFGLV